MVRARRLPEVLPAAVLAAALAVSAVLTVAPSPAPHPLVEVVAAAWMASLALLSTSITTTTVLVVLGATAYTAIPDAPVTPLWAFIAALVLSFSIGLQTQGSRCVLLAGLMLACFFLMSTLDHGAQSFSDRWVTPVVISLLPLLAGRLVRHERHQATELARLSVQLTAEREATARAAATDERNRVAGELHEVISRSVGTMVVQAGAAELVLPPGSPARGALDAVRRTGRQALAELQQQLGALSAAAPSSGVRSVPDLVGLPALAAGSGARLEYDAHQVGEVPAGAALTAYRVVQEALTNARKHATGGPVLVRVERSEDELAVEVVNGPGQRLADASTGGHGLIGMSERVALYSGRLETGPTAEGGWRVHAQLPLPAPVRVGEVRT